MGDHKTSGTVQVPLGLNLKTRFFAATAKAWMQLARLESAVLRDAISQAGIKKPIYVTGVPRAGTTIITELLERHPDVTSHRYSDFPNVYTPFWRNWLSSRARRGPTRRVERSHGDRIMVTPESPEAVEEVIWMQFFHPLHDPDRNQVLDETAQNDRFESFYREHIQKLLLVRNAKRYLAKGNYNIGRLRYILKQFPDAKFLVIVRNPVNHIASLIKQDRRFHAASKQDERVPEQLAQSGHFEFGPCQRAINLGNWQMATEIERCWQTGNLVGAWARYWASTYSFFLDQLSGNEELRRATLLVGYEQLCAEPEPVIRKMLDHCELDASKYEALITEYKQQISEPEYYEPGFSSQDLQTINEIASNVAHRLGYNNRIPEGIE